jgi:hypothetical protein
MSHRGQPGDLEFDNAFFVVLGLELKALCLLGELYLSRLQSFSALFFT